MLGFSLSKRKKKKPRILIIEDSKTFLQVLKLKLKSLYNDDVEIKGFTESETFLEDLDQEVQAIVMDFYLDDQSEFEGLELLKKIKLHVKNAFVLILTGEEDLEVAKKCYELGANSYLVKSSESIDNIAKEIYYKIELASR